MALSAKQQAFVEHYLRCWNATEAARLAGYSEKSARKQGSRMSTNVDIQAAVQARLAELKMSADEVLSRLSDQARGTMADFADILVDGEIVAPESMDEAHAKIVGWKLNLAKAQARGKLHLIKKLKSGQWGPELELYDAQSALFKLGEHHRLWVQRQELSGPDGAPIEVVDARDQLARRLARRAADADEG